MSLEEKYKGKSIRELKSSYWTIVYELEALESNSFNNNWYNVFWDENLGFWREDEESSKVKVLEEEANFLWASILKYGA